MKLIPILLISILAIGSGLYFSHTTQMVKPMHISIVEKYNKWRSQYRKLYASPSEMNFRMTIFAEKLKMVEDANAHYEEQVRLNNDTPLTGPMFSLKSFSDLTTVEFKKKFTGIDLSKAKNTHIDEVDLSKPAKPLGASESSGLGQTAFKIRVRNQGECGSCWAFSTVATIERKYFDQTKTQLDLSQQELVDCSTEDSGCDGGWPFNTYSYVKNYGISTGTAYPYYGNQGYCEREGIKRVTFDQSFGPKQHDFALPILSRVINAGIIPGICVYSSGQFSHISSSDDVYNARYGNECSQTVDHAVNLSGAGADFAVVLNSWGTDWGNQGLKKIRPCTASNLLGTPSLISHTSRHFA